MEKAKIIIVEDEAIIAMEVESSLQSLGYEVTSIVDTGVKAIEKAEVDKPDIILMDIRIKGEMDGIKAAEVIRNRFGIPVVFSTAYLDEERIERAKITMPFGYVLKPIQERDLKITIEMALYVSKVDLERKRAEETLKKSEHRLATHIKLTPMGVIEFDKEFKPTSWNPGAERIFGYTKEEAIGKNSLDLIVPDHELESVKKIHVSVNPEVSENVNDNKTKDGRMITCQWFNTPLFDIHGNLVGMTAVCRDITNQLNVEQALKESEKNFRLLFETSPLGTYTADPDGTILDVNQALLTMLGSPSVEATRQINVRKHPPLIESGYTKKFIECVETGRTVTMELLYKSKWGKEAVLSNYIVPLKDNNGKVVKVYTVMEDITKRKKIEEALK